MSEEIKLTEAEMYAFLEIRRHLKAGATIKATDPSKVLESMDDPNIYGDKVIYGGLTITYPDNTELIES